jgi:hypothetical protein
MTLTFTLLPQRYAVARLGASEAMPPWSDGEGFVSICRTADELSVVCDESRVPAAVKAERGWRCLKVEGPFAFDVTGVAAFFTGVLANAGLSCLVISTFDTDYVLVKEAVLPDAVEALRAAGCRVD